MTTGAGLEEGVGGTEEGSGPVGGGACSASGSGREVDVEVDEVAAEGADVEGDVGEGLDTDMGLGNVAVGEVRLPHQCFAHSFQLSAQRSATDRTVSQ